MTIGIIVGNVEEASPLFFVRSAFHLHDRAYRNRSIDKNKRPPTLALN